MCYVQRKLSKKPCKPHIMQWECRREGPLVHQPLHAHLPLLLLPEGGRGQDLPADAGALGAGEEGIGVLAPKEPECLLYVCLVQVSIRDIF